jgi:hypothetical protein
MRQGEELFKVLFGSLASRFLILGVATEHAGKRIEDRLVLDRRDPLLRLPGSKLLSAVRTQRCQVLDSYLDEDSGRDLAPGDGAQQLSSEMDIRHSSLLSN